MEATADELTGGPVPGPSSSVQAVEAPPPASQDNDAKKKEKKIIRELSVLCTKGNNSVPAKTFAEFLRSRMHSNDAAEEVEDLVHTLTSAKREPSEIDGLSDYDRHMTDTGMSGGRGNSNSLVILKAGVILSEKSSSIRFTKASALAYVSRKLSVMTEASQEADKAQLSSDNIQGVCLCASSPSHSA